MEPEFWLECWRNNEIGFHQPSHNSWLVRHWAALEVPPGAGVLVPLCGKSLDMRWLEAQGHPVFGIELSELAIRAYFEGAGESFEVFQAEYGFLKRFTGPGTVIYCGNLFDLTAPHIRGVQAAFDRGALVALPARMRERYVDHLLRVLPDGARILLLTLEYDQSLVAGPPFSVPEQEVVALYQARCRVEQLEATTATDLPPKFAKAGDAAVRQVAYKIVKQH